MPRSASPHYVLYALSGQGVQDWQPLSYNRPPLHHRERLTNFLEMPQTLVSRVPPNSSGWRALLEIKGVVSPTTCWSCVV
jgi:hypothetical protein